MIYLERGEGGSQMVSPPRPRTGRGEVGIRLEDTNPQGASGEVLTLVELGTVTTSGSSALKMGSVGAIRWLLFVVVSEG